LIRCLRIAEGLNTITRRGEIGWLAGGSRIRGKMIIRLTRQALSHLREEEIPRRIAFVSDKVFEPTRFARWWSGMPKLAFGLALVLAVFFGGVWATRPSLTVETGKWQLAFGGGSSPALAEMEARHTAQMRTVEETYDLLMKQMNQLYLRQAEMAPASYRQ